MICPRCGSKLMVLYASRYASVGCVGWGCEFGVPASEDLIIAAVMAHHMRALDEPHAYVAHPDYPGQCDAPIGSPARACGRGPECHEGAQ